MKISVYKKDIFLFGHYMWVMREVNIFFSLYVYMNFWKSLQEDDKGTWQDFPKGNRWGI